MKPTPLTHYRGYAITALPRGRWEYYSETAKKCVQTATLEEAREAIRQEWKQLDAEKAEREAAGN